MQCTFPLNYMKVKNFYAQGFTLIELLMVVVIIGILVGIGVPALKNAKIDAQNAKIAAVKAQVSTAKSRFWLDATDQTAASTFNALDNEAKLNALSSYILVNGAPLSTDATTNTLAGAILKGTGQTVISVGNIGDGTAMTAPSIP